MEDFQVKIVATGLSAMVIIACIAVFGGFVVVGAIAAIAAVVIAFPPPPRVTDE